MTLIFIGNIISFLGACFTVISSWCKNFKRTYLYQTVQCLLLGISNIFFQAYSGTITLLLCGARDYLAAYNKVSGRICVLFSALILVLGIATNNRGFWGLIPVFTTVVYTVLCYFTKNTIGLKINTIQNLVLWAVYDFVIMDYVSFTVDSVSAFLALAAIFRIFRDRKVQKKEK